MLTTVQPAFLACFGTLAAEIQYHVDCHKQHQGSYACQVSQNLFCLTIPSS